MDIVVPMQQTVDLVEELELNDEGTDVEREYLKFVANEWDEQALEEALLLKDAAGGTVTVVGIDETDVDGTLYSALAKGADRAVKLTGDFESGVSSHHRAALLAAWLGDQSFDLVLVGVQSPEDLDGQTGVILANLLDVAHVSVAIGVEPHEGGVKVSQEFGGGVVQKLALSGRAVVGIQAAREAPRYVSISRVRDAMKQGGLEEAAAPDADAATGTTVRRLYAPESTSHAEMLEGDAEAVAARIMEIVRERGLVKTGELIMGNDIFVLVEHTHGTVDDSTHELLGKARELAGQSGGRAVACLLHSGAKSAAEGLAADAVLSVEHDALEHFLPEAYVKAMAALLAEHEPRATLIANTTVGMDVAGGLSARAKVPLVAYCTAISLEGDELVATSQVFGGKLNAEVAVDGAGICSVVAGSFEPATGGSPEVEDVAPSGLDDLATTFLERVEPEVSDVDVTAEEILISVGRGIGGEDNIELAQELADALGGVVSASRPVTDSGWLPKTRQVGKSGQKVKPKLYIAIGISGAPEHLEGMGDAELIIAINTDENAPIFEVAHYGTTEDLFDVLPALTEQVEAAVSA